MAALFSYLNHRFLGLPTTIGLMLIGLTASVVLIVTGLVFPSIEARAVELMSGIDFGRTLMEGLLGFLLFAGALHIDLRDLAEQKFVIAILATIGLLISTFIVGIAMWFVFAWLSVPVPFLACLLFGALISPTDPIAVLSVLRSLGAPRSLATKIAGESLFNDGVGVVIFLAILGVSGFDAGHTPTDPAYTLANVLRLFAQETLGGVALGLAAGFVTFRMMRSIEDHDVEVLLSVALVAGGYALAVALHVSGPIAMVIAGLMIGNYGRRLAMGDRTRRYLDTFWSLVDEMLNAVLFVLIGFEILLIPFEGERMLGGLFAIPVVLFGRFIAVGIPVQIMRPLRAFTPHAVKVLCWGGLRGGISVALALSLKSTLGREDPTAYEAILVTTYLVVVFSIAVQGLTIGPVLRRLGLSPGSP